MADRLELDLTPLVGSLQSILGFNLEEVAHEAVTESSALLLNRIRSNFLAQVSPSGEAWEPSYAAFLRSFGIGRGGKRVKAGGGTLFETGTLFHSIQLYEAGPLEMVIGSDVYYGVFHNEGTAHLPQREFLGFSDLDGDLALKVLFQKLEDALS